VDLRVHVLAAEAVAPCLGEVGEDLRVPGLEEGALPERLRLGLGRDDALGLLGLAALVAVDDEERLKQLIGRDAPSLGQQLRELSLDELLLDVDAVPREFPRPDLAGDGS